ncbi:unnamed protein product [Rotaria sordida]|uniref:Secreted protein n=1 Tax=Rotaria sordida TaxID=392033 RepID=A0A813Z5S8_9BILA|nr:unnamed protein product [Rotaria sordida]
MVSILSLIISWSIIGIVVDSHRINTEYSHRGAAQPTKSLRRPIYSSCWQYQEGHTQTHARARSITRRRNVAHVLCYASGSFLCCQACVEPPTRHRHAVDGYRLCLLSQSLLVRSESHTTEVRSILRCLPSFHTTYVPEATYLNERYNR